MPFSAKRLIQTFFLLAILAVSSCAPSRFVEPLAKNESAISAEFGGPVVNLFGASFPTPLISVAYGRGISDNITVFGGLHATSAVFGVVQAEVGAVVGLLPHDSLNPFVPGISATPVLNIAFDGWEGQGRLWPQTDLNFYWNYGKRRSLIYTGFSNWYVLSQKRAHEEVQPNQVIWNPHLGHTLKGEKWDFNTEIKFIAPNKSNQEVVVDYAKVLGKSGAMGAYISVVRRF